MTDPLAFARRLVDMGVPVFAAPPDPDGRTPSGKAVGYTLPARWQTFRADPRRLDVWRPGHALCAIGGHALDFVDVDPRNDGMAAMDALMAAGTWPRTYATVTTPSGGLHAYIAALRVGKTKRDGIDLQAGSGNETSTPDGRIKSDRGFVFLPGTERVSKATGLIAPYALVADRLDTFGRDDDSGAALRAWFAERKPSSSTSGEAGGLGAPIERGAHQETLFRYASSLRARGVREAEAAALVELRARDCVPPWGGPDTPWEAVRHVYRAYPEGSGPTPVLELVRPAGSPPPAAPSSAPAARRRVVATPATSRTMRAARWLWEDDGGQWVPLGGLVLLGGREGIGKSTWGYRIAAMVTRGTLPGDMFGRPRGVAICATEDSWEHTVLPRLAAAGADLARVYELTAVDGDLTSGVTLPVDVAEVTAVCAEHDVGLLLLDPLLGTISGRLDTHKDAEVRQALEPLSRLAHDSEATVIGLIHENKGQGADLLTRLMGSRAFAAVARAVLVCAEEKSELQESDFGDSIDLEKGPKRSFLFGQEKNNLGRRVEHSIRYEIEGALVARDHALNKDVWSSRIKPVGMADERVGQLVERQEAASRPGKGRPGVQVVAAERFVKQRIEGWDAVPVAQVMAAGKAAGFSESTIKRARLELGIESVLVDGLTCWRLPATGTEA